MRNFGIQSGARDLGGTSISRSAYSADNTRADANIIQFPVRELPPALVPLLKHGPVLQSLIDVATMLVWMFIGAVGLLILYGPIFAVAWWIFFSS